MCYLAGFFRNSMLNLEINGPGQAVFAEMQALRRRAAAIPRALDTGLKNFLANLQYYLYRRMDTIGGGVVYHWKTTTDTKERAFNTMRDLVDRNEAVLKSEGLLDEMKVIVRDDGFLGASGRAKDDRFMAACLAAVQYVDYIKFKLASEKRTYANETMKKERARKEKLDGVKLDEPISSALTKGVKAHLLKIGIK